MERKQPCQWRSLSDGAGIGGGGRGGGAKASTESNTGPTAPRHWYGKQPLSQPACHHAAMMIMMKHEGEGEREMGVGVCVCVGGGGGGSKAKNDGKERLSANLVGKRE